VTDRAAFAITLAAAALTAACTSAPPIVHPPRSMAPVVASSVPARDVTPSYVAPDPRAVATAIAHMEARSDATTRDRYLTDVKEKTGCTVRVLVARLPAGKNLEARALAREAAEEAELQRDPMVDRVGSAHVSPTDPLTVTLSDGRSVAVGVISVVVATEVCTAPSPSAPASS